MKLRKKLQHQFDKMWMNLSGPNDNLSQCVSYFVELLPWMVELFGRVIRLSYYWASFIWEHLG